MSQEATMYTFETPGPVNLRVEHWVGRVEIHADDTTQTTVELEPRDSTAQDIVERTRVEQRGGDVVVLMPKVKGGFFGRKGEVFATIRVPRMSNAKIETASADLETLGELADVNVATGSGDVHLQHIKDGRLQTGSGDVSIDTATGSLDAKCGSADLRVGSIGRDATLLAGSGDVVVEAINGNLKVKTGSGDVLLASAGDSVDAMAGSGDVQVQRIHHGRLKARTGSGDVSVGVAAGTAAYLDVMTVTGDVTSSLDGSEAPKDGEPTVELVIQAGSGDVLLQRA